MHVSVIGNPDDTVVVTVRGNLDLATAPVLRTTLDQVLDRPHPRVVVDVSGVGFCDPAGLGEIVSGHRRAAGSGGWVRLAAPGDWLPGLLRTAGPMPALGIFPTVADALAAGL
ncbi:anti-sigma factor antagonist [Actinoplanes sp. NBRC 14428]|uniref:Anti-anti-sigma factor n=1 Tax=Pseudosporangium ferrugineum TaxID=439699 RepID=A0A2T0SI22_9ACTN|nr:STAS domain-containing protein [Pseudosporangium ferrugineum]PRY33068.1 anti-anti-sigma factor [Pseudosporangium ferrugineum]BCJ48952.1 anti-sigma factor antagonist [Actinoplanes sp. NBRC 14428]